MAVELAVVGAGRTGRTLGLLARRAGIAIGPVVCRTAAHARAAAAFIGAGRPMTQPEGADLTIVAVPDGEIGAVARGLRLPPGAVVAHTCGSLGAEALRPLRPAGAVHPLRSFADPARAAAEFAGTACAVDGDPAAARVLRRFVRRIGGTVLDVKSGRKALYHAGAVFASNYVISVLAAAQRLLEEAGVPRRRASGALAALASGTLSAARASGLPAALTGPVERGDAETVRRHAAAVASRAPDLSGVYEGLGRIALRVALEKGSVGRAAAQAVGRALRAPGTVRS